MSVSDYSLSVLLQGGVVHERVQLLCHSGLYLLKVLGDACKIRRLYVASCENLKKKKKIIKMKPNLVRSHIKFL